LRKKKDEDDPKCCLLLVCSSVWWWDAIRRRRGLGGTDKGARGIIDTDRDTYTHIHQSHHLPTDPTRSSDGVEGIGALSRWRDLNGPPQEKAAAVAAAGPAKCPPCPA
jgi:hypothetical protein